MDARGGASHRAQLLADVTGTIVEVGAGAGATFLHYGSEVHEVIAVEPDGVLRARAEDVATRTSTPITVVAGDAEHVPVPSGSADWVVCSLVLCTVPDAAAALQEFRRVLRPDGGLAFYEHVRSSNAGIARIESAVTPVWSAVAGGCHLDRDTALAITDAGYSITRLRRFAVSPAGVVPRIAHVAGIARPVPPGGPRSRG
jgi:SAM-dependent methyltransferase